MWIGRFGVIVGFQDLVYVYFGCFCGFSVLGWCGSSCFGYADLLLICVWFSGAFGFPGSMMWWVSWWCGGFWLGCWYKAGALWCSLNGGCCLYGWWVSGFACSFTLGVGLV